MKKSFVLYNDTLEILNEIDDNQAGKLFKYIARYNRGESFDIVEPDIRILFFSFKKQFIRDDEKYEKKAQRNREVGALGGRPRKNVEPEKPNETQTVILEPKKPNETQTVILEPEKPKIKTKVEKAVEIPTFDEIKEYLEQKSEKKIDFFKMNLKYQSYIESGWKDGNGKPIKNWKSKFLNLIPYNLLEYGKNNSGVSNQRQSATYDRSDAIDGANAIFSDY